MKEAGRAVTDVAAAAELAALSALVARRLVATQQVPSQSSNRTDIVTSADGRRFAVQRLADAVPARHRIRLGRLLQPLLDAAGVPTPTIVTADPDSRPPYLVTELVPGRSGAELLGEPVGAIALGTEMGRLLGRLQSVRVDDLRIPSTWADPARLAAVSGRWLRRAHTYLDGETHAFFVDAVGRLPDLFADRSAVLAHGDWAPVNVLVENGAIVAVLDWEFARLADPLLDIAWWGWIVWFHHPTVYLHAWPAFLETAGVVLDPTTVERLRVLAPLRLLEALAQAVRGSDPARRTLWAERIRRTIFPEE